MTKKKTGVQEWAKHSFNFQKGCMNGCLKLQMILLRLLLILLKSIPKKLN